MLRMLSTMDGIQGGNPYFSLYKESDWVLLSSKGVGGGYGYLRFHIRQADSILDVFEKVDGLIPYAAETDVAGCFGSLFRYDDSCYPTIANRVVFESDTHECCGKIVFGASNTIDQIASFRTLLESLDLET